MAVLLRGEGAEQTPIVILRGWKGIEFDESGSMADFKIPPEKDLYKPLLDVIV
jgi:F420-0:gamma-glutamyl ligase